MTPLSNKAVYTTGSVLLLASAIAGAYYHQVALLLVPAGLMVVLLFLQYPSVLFYALLFSIPWSVETNLATSLSLDLPDELLMLLTAFSAIALLLIDAGKESFRKKLYPLLWILCASVAWLVVTVLLSTHFVFSVKYLLAKGWYLLAFVLAPLLLKRDKELVKRSAVVLFTSMFMVTCIALYKHAGLGFTFAKINTALAPYFRNHVNYSALLVCMVPVQMAFFRLTKKKTLKIIVLLTLVVVLAALVLSYARGAWLALLAGLAAFWLIKRGWLFRSFLLLLLLVAGFVFWLQYNDHYLRFAPEHDTTVFHQDFSEHLEATYKGKDVSTAERFYRWVAGARMSRDQWLTGFGPTTFYQHYKSYTIPLFRTWVSDNREQSTVHNYFLLLAIEQGAVGLALFILLVGAMFWYAQKIYRQTDHPFWKTTAATIAAILWMQCTVNFLSDLIETDKVGSVFYLCVAFLVIADAKTKRKTVGTKPEEVW